MGATWLTNLAGTGAITNAPWTNSYQPAAANLTNWATLSTNAFASTAYVDGVGNARVSRLSGVATNLSLYSSSGGSPAIAYVGGVTAFDLASDANTHAFTVVAGRTNTTAATLSGYLEFLGDSIVDNTSTNDLVVFTNATFVWVAGSSQASNNGLKRVTSISSGTLVFEGESFAGVEEEITLTAAHGVVIRPGNNLWDTNGPTLGGANPISRIASVEDLSNKRLVGPIITNYVDFQSSDPDQGSQTNRIEAIYDGEYGPGLRFYLGQTNYVLWEEPVSDANRLVTLAEITLTNAEALNVPLQQNRTLKSLSAGSGITLDDSSTNVVIAANTAEFQPASATLTNLAGTDYLTFDDASYNFYLGYHAGINDAGSANLYVGYRAGSSDGASNGSPAAVSNTGLGNWALRYNATGHNNTAVGQNTLLNNISGLLNTAVGADTMFQNTNGIYNVAVGTDALHLSYSGNWNVAIGSLALYDITTGANNTALGYWSGKGLAHGSGNTILGANTTVSSGVSNNIILADGNGTIRLRDDGTNWTFAGGVLVTNGNVGIGTTAPLAPLSVSNSAATLFQLSSPGNNAVATITTNGSAKFQSGTYYPSNTFLPTAAMLGAGGFWLVNSNGNLVTLYSLDGSTTAMKVLAP